MKKNEQWIINATLVTQNNKRDVYKKNIRIVDNQIVELTNKTPRTGNLLDAKGLFIFPGFIQTHIHLCQTLFRNLADDLELLNWLKDRIWKLEAAHTKESLSISAQLGIAELLSSGTTCILDMGTVKHTEEIFKAAAKIGIRANIGKCLMDRRSQNPKDLCENTESAISEALELYQKWNGAKGDRLRASFAPRFVISCTEDLLKQVAELSSLTGALVHTHASENQKEIELVKKLTGKNNIQYLDFIGLASSRLVLAHGVWPKKGELEVLKKTKSNVTHCPSSNLKLASGIAPIPEYLKSKINVSLGADGAPCNNRLNVFDEMRLAALIHKPKYGPRAMPAHLILDLVTRNGAKALHWDDQIGSIEVGKKADLVGIDLKQVENFCSQDDNYQAICSALVYSTQSKNVQFTMVDGKILYKKGKLKGLNINQLLSNTATHLERFKSLIQS